MTLTTEQLRARAAAYRTDAATLAEMGDKESSQRLNESANAFDELADNREAQPVLYASEETLAYAKEGEKSLVTWSEPMGDAVIPLYTAPPAPAVPEEMKRDPDADVFDPGFMNGWNACRAAMLAQPVSGGYKLVPVEPTEAMHVAARDWSAQEYGKPIGIDASLGCYKAMLAAAPEKN